MMETIYDATLFHCTCEARNISINVVLKLLEVGGKDLVTEKMIMRTLHYILAALPQVLLYK